MTITHPPDTKRVMIKNSDMLAYAIKTSPLSCRDLAFALRVSKSAVALYGSGRGPKAVARPVAKRIAEKLGAPYDLIFFDQKTTFFDQKNHPKGMK